MASMIYMHKLHFSNGRAC